MGLVLVAIGLVAAGLAQLRIETGIESFLPSGDPAVAGLQDRARSFGGDPIVVLIESDRPDTLTGPDVLPRLVGLEGELSAKPDVSVVYGPGTVLNQVAIQSQNVLAQISGRRDGIRATAEKAARDAGDGDSAVDAAVRRSTIEFDQRYGSLLVQGLPTGLPTLKNPDFVRTVLFDENGETRPQWRYVVPSRVAVALLIRPTADLDQAGTERLVESIRDSVTPEKIPSQRITVTGVPVVTASLGQQVRDEAPLLGSAAILVIGTGFLLLQRSGSRRRRLMPPGVALAATAVTLAIAGWARVPLSLGVVTFLPILLGIGSFYTVYLLHRAGRRRVTAVAAASAASFASLSVSSLPFVRELGLALAVGVLVSLGLAVVAVRLVAPAPDPSAPVVSATMARPRPDSVRRRITALVVAGTVAAVGWGTLPSLRVEADPQHLASGLSALDDVGVAERVLGSSGEISIVLRGTNVASPQALAWERAAQQAVTVTHGDQVRPIVSVPDVLRFLGPAPSPAQLTAALDLVPKYLADAVVRPDRQESVITLGIRLQDLDSQARLLDQIRATLPPVPDGYVVDVVGLPVAAARGYDLVSVDRYAGNLAGIAAAGVVLALGLRRRRDALRAVIAATLATGWGLALVWIIGEQLSPLTVALGSLTAAVGCEFTVLLAQARRLADRWQQRAVTTAATTAALGFAVLGLSSLSVLRQFGLFLAASVALSLLAARLVVRMMPDSRESIGPPVVPSSAPSLIGEPR